MKLLKILIIIAVGVVCMLAAARHTEGYAAEVSSREKTLAEAVMKSRLEAELKRAEEQAERELAEQGETLVTEVMETKPPVTETTTAETEATTAVPETETETETTAAPDEIVTEFTRGGLLPEDRTGVPIRSMFGLSAEEQDRVIGFLVEHYFLDGYKYSAAEERPLLKEKKLLAAEMENSVVTTLNMVMENVNTTDVSAVLSADYAALIAEAEGIRDEFGEKYKDVYLQGEAFGVMYESSLKYFDRLIYALGEMEKTAEQYKNAANPLLALGLLTSSLDGVIIPEITGVLEQSFDLVETSQEIFLEGTQGARLLTRDEVKDIIANPALVLNTNLD
ncbi:MAG: hypothetical protein J6C96_00840 [Oscillospiraceae bacterium]|nr:hypothetical protein [Oscillospiraceae bacterium]